MKKIIILLFPFIIISCATPIKSIPLKHRNNTSSELNLPIKKEIGDRLILKGEEDYQEAYLIINTPKFTGTMLNYPYTNGDVLPLDVENKDLFLYYSKESTQGTMKYIAGIAKNKLDNRILPFFNSGNGFITKTIKEFSAKEFEYINPNCPGCFKKEFIFNGKTGTSLKFVYREYVNDMARPAFNQDLQYDLADGNIVGFKGLRIEIIKATNTNIEYKILSNFTE